MQSLQAGSMAPMIQRLAPEPTRCPSCKTPMDIHHVEAHGGVGTLELDLCHTCHGIWFDDNESLRIGPRGVMELFRLLHEHRDDPQAALAHDKNCPRCRRTLQESSDVVRTGRYFTYRCPQRHGRFSTFSSFMIEKGFVRQLSPVEVTNLAERLKVIHCSNCGAAVDLRQHAACPYCQSAFSLLDPQAVEQALARYHRRALRVKDPQPASPSSPDLADALIALERDRARAQREQQKERWSQKPASPMTTSVDDLWSAGLEMVWNFLSR